MDVDEAYAVLRLPSMHDGPTCMKALKCIMPHLPPDIQVVVTASLTMGREIGVEHGVKLAREASGVTVQTGATFIQSVETMNSKTLSENKDSNIATSGGSVNDNDGQQQAVNVGKGSAVATGSTQTRTQADTFEQEAFNREVVEVMHTMTDRMFDIEQVAHATATEALGSLGRADLHSKTLEEACAMIDDLWTAEMKRKYKPTLATLFGENGALKDVVSSIPNLWALLSKVLGLNT